MTAQILRMSNLDMFPFTELNLADRAKICKIKFREYFFRKKNLPA